MKKIQSEHSQIRLDSQRREFIKKTTLAGAGVIATSLLPVSAVASTTDEKKGTSQQKGYQLTQHVIDYYKSAAN